MGTYIEKKDIADIREQLENYVGQRVKMRGNKGRNRPFEFEGILKAVYPNYIQIQQDGVFKPDSCSYDEIKRGVYELDVNIGNNGEFSSILDNMNPNVIL